jgi:predicted glycoside hydrolase/deacetylase ChbG (UPF0249 family)
MVNKALIVCADDYAADSACSHGIAALARAGRLSAVSVMALSPRWERDAAALRELRRGIDVGLHLDWTSPFARAAGHGLPLGRAMLRAALVGFDRAHARSVIERQLDAFERHWRAPPDHVDGHQHVQQFAGIREALVATLARRYAPARPWLRVSRVKAAPTAAGGLKGRAITALGAAALQALAARAGLPCATELWGVYDFKGGAAGYAARLDAWLAHAPARAVLMCHPAQGQGQDPATATDADPIAAARRWEFEVLGGAAFQQTLRRHGVVPARGSLALD